jgi:Protein of unknown function (DUF1549)/Protein of unknown function (DUF1553)
MRFRIAGMSAALAVFCAACLSIELARAESITPTDIAELKVFPPTVNLNTNADRQSLIVQAVYNNELTRDVTAEAKITSANADLVRLDANMLYPKADGQSEITVEYGGRSVKVPLVVKDAAADRPISFHLDVMPVFAKAGCNTGSCHGAARGKDGFRLSLFGFDPDGDYQRITREIGGRRINLAQPEHSLLIEKALGQVPHTGGVRFAKDSELCRTLLKWIDAGVPNDGKDIPKLTGLEIYPQHSVLNGPGEKQQLIVRATYSDGHDRDVTSLAYFLSSNDPSAAVSPEGAVTAGQRGEALITARFGAITIGTQFIVLPKDLEFTFPETPENNYIDTLVDNKLKKLRIAPSQLCTDEEFLRRVYLDIVGLLPTTEEYTRFMSNPEANKRDLLVDELLERPEFVEMWVMKWAELLQIRTTNDVKRKGALMYYDWLKERVGNNMPVDQMVRELLSASGGSFTNPATNYYDGERNTLKIAENVAQVFMGMRIQCAQCHNHPFDRWTLDDYYSFAAFFAQIGNKQAEDPREHIVFDRGNGDVKHPVTGQVMTPKFLGGPTPDIAGRDRRVVLAEWLASPENPYFATNLANIVWAHFFGRGIIQEVDDVRVTNPPVNPELLGELGKRFTESHYDFKKLVHDICTSRTYQLSSQTNESNAGDERNFSHSLVRRLRAEVLLDVITQVTDTKNKFPALPLGARAVEVPDGNTTTYFLTTFGRATRETVCSCAVKMEPNLSQALHLLNGDTVTNRIREGKLIDRRFADKKSNNDIIDELYVRTLTRRPTAEESSALSAALDESTDKKKQVEDVFWALLNSREFSFNH